MTTKAQMELDMELMERKVQELLDLSDSLNVKITIAGEGKKSEGAYPLYLASTNNTPPEDAAVFAAAAAVMCYNKEVRELDVYRFLEVLASRFQTEFMSLVDGMIQKTIEKIMDGDSLLFKKQEDKETQH